MLPLPILDGGKFIHIIIDKKMSEKAVNATMWAIYAFTLLIILYFEIVFAVFCNMEFEKQSEQSFSPEYFLENTAILPHLVQFTKEIFITQI